MMSHFNWTNRTLFAQAPGVLTIGVVSMSMLFGIACQKEDVPVSIDTPPGSMSVQSPIDPEIEQALADIRSAEPIQHAFAVIEALESETRQVLFQITETPAPPFKETERAILYAGLLDDAGADSVWIDAEGNVLGLRRGTGTEKRTLALAAHLDTVFPEGTDVTVRVKGDTLFAPGIGDDSRGLVEVLTVLKALVAADIRARNDVLFVGTVGEEGLGDLRGVKHLFSDSGPGIDSWIAIDGGRMGNIVHQGLGSHRYRVTFNGPGGHSWGAFGLANPHHALGDAIRRFVERADSHTQSGPRTSYNVGVISGGTSVNSIPFASAMEIDMRSVDPDRLQEIDAMLHVSVQEALHDQNERRRSGPALTVDVDMIGNRPSGALPRNAPIVQRAVAATALMHGTTSFSISSTDSNIPISLGIPAITIGRGGRGGNAHSLDEWWINDRGYRSIQWTLLIVLAEAGWNPDTAS